MNNNLLNEKYIMHYQYLDIIDDKRYHLVSLEKIRLNLLIPIIYKISYSESCEYYENNGYITFEKEDKKFYFSFIKKEYEEYKLNIEKESKYIVRNFNNYQNKEFTEIKKDNIDYIYMYYQNYEYKIYSNYKFTLNELFDMYYILFSVSDISIISNYNLLEQLDYINKNSIKLFYENINILEFDLSIKNEKNKLSEELVIINSDVEYLEYKNILYRVNELITSDDFEINIYDNKCYFKGMFDLYNFGKYKCGELIDFDEIVLSQELSLEDKEDLILTIIQQKQAEVDNAKEIIHEVVLNYCYEYIKKNITYNKFIEYHLLDYINQEKISDKLNNREKYLWMIDNIDNYDIFDKELIVKSLKGLNMFIYSNYYKMKINGLNNFIYEQEIKLNDNFIISD